MTQNGRVKERAVTHDRNDSDQEKVRKGRERKMKEREIETSDPGNGIGLKEP